MNWPESFLLPGSLALAGVCLVVGALYLLHRNLRFSALQFSLCALLLLGGGFQAGYMAEHSRQRVVLYLSSVGPLLSEALSAAGHARLELDTDPDDPTYHRVLEVLARWGRTMAFTNDVYTIRPDGSGTWYLIADAGDDDADGGLDPKDVGQPIGTPAVWPDVEGGMARAWAGESYFVRQAIVDQWGRWVTLWSPIRDDDGRVEAVLGIDFGADRWDQLETDEVRGVLRLLLPTIGALLLVFGIVSVQRRAMGRVFNAVRQSRDERFGPEELVDAVPAPMILFGAEGECLRINGMAESLFGYSSTEAAGTRLFEALMELPARSDIAGLADFIANLKPGANDFHMRRKDGSSFTGRLRGIVQRDSSGKPLVALLQVRDVTEDLEIERRARRSDRHQAIARLADGLAHDMNNALGPAALALQSLRAVVGNDQEVLDIIERGIARCTRLLDRLGTFAQNDARIYDPIDLGRLTADLKKRFDSLMLANRVLDIVAEESLPGVYGDHVQLEGAIWALIENAVDATREGGLISVCISQIEVNDEWANRTAAAIAGSYLAIAVSDNGAGIPAELRDHLFDPFVTSKGTTTESMGLGLSVLYGVVRAHNGFVEVQSEPGQGTTIVLYLPCVPGR